MMMPPLPAPPGMGMPPGPGMMPPLPAPPGMGMPPGGMDGRHGGGHSLRHQEMHPPLPGPPLPLPGVSRSTPAAAGQKSQEIDNLSGSDSDSEDSADIEDINDDDI